MKLSEGITNSIKIQSLDRMTVGDVIEIVGHHEHAGKLPKPATIKKEEGRLPLLIYDSADAKITVYKDGLLILEEAGYETSMTVEQCCTLSYEPNYTDMYDSLGNLTPGISRAIRADRNGMKYVRDSIGQEFFLDMLFVKAVKIIGEDRLSHNSDERYHSYAKFSYDDVRDLDDLICSDADPLEQIIKEEEDADEQKLFRRAMDAYHKLNLKDQAIIDDIVYKNRKQEEIASEKRISQSAVCQRYKAACKRLSKLFDALE